MILPLQHHQPETGDIQTDSIETRLVEDHLTTTQNLRPDPTGELNLCNYLLWALVSGDNLSTQKKELV